MNAFCMIPLKVFITAVHCPGSGKPKDPMNFMFGDDFNCQLR